MSPCELEREFEAAELRQQDAIDRDVSLAWHTAVFHQQATLGKLKDLRMILTRRLNPSGTQTPEQQRRVLMDLSEQYGIPLKVH